MGEEGHGDEEADERVGVQLVDASLPTKRLVVLTDFLEMRERFLGIGGLDWPIQSPGLRLKFGHDGRPVLVVAALRDGVLLCDFLRRGGQDGSDASGVDVREGALFVLFFIVKSGFDTMRIRLELGVTNRANCS